MVNPVYTYDANGNMIAGAGRTTVWTSFNIPSRIDNQTPNGIKTAAFWYNPEHERTKELQADQSIVVTLSPRYDTGLHFEKRYLAANGALTGAVEYEHYLYAGGQMFGKYITTTQTDGVTQATTAIEYYLKDNLGSIVAITDGAGAIKQRLSYDVWGKRRYPNGAADPNGLLNNPDMYHGFTGHEMLDDVGLIHMNGRLYDPVTARFVSADPYIQAPDNLQSYNRYTYGWNNPLNGTDPSGYSWWTSIRGIVVRAIAAAADAYGCSGYCSAAVGAYQGSQNGGGLTGGIVGGVVAYIGYQTSVNYPLTNQGGSIIWQNVAIGSMINAATGCASAAASGGDCGRGALSGAVGTVGSAYGNVGAVIAGCAAGKISGGSCRDGAVNALETYAVYATVHGAVRYINESSSRPQSNQLIALPAMGAVEGLGAAAVVTGVVLGGMQWVVDVYDSIVYASSYRSRALIAAGMDPASPEARNYEVHHVVEQGRFGAEPARANLAAVGIGINDLENLVVLPKPHQGIHTISYTQSVNLVTRAARPGGYNSMVNTLNSIKSSLIVKGSYP